MGDQMALPVWRIRDTQNTDNVETLEVAGLFVAIGHSPNTAIFGRSAGAGKWLHQIAVRHSR